MTLAWLTVFLTCAGVMANLASITIVIGGALACLTNTRCPITQYDAVTALEAGNTTEYCRLESIALACYAADASDCPNSNQVLQPMYDKYYSKCFLSASDVASCQLQTSNCNSLMQAAVDHASSGNIQGFCGGFETYMTCVRNGIQASCNINITIYDVMGARHDLFVTACTSGNIGGSLQACQAKVSAAGCYSLMGTGGGSGPPDIAAQCSGLRALINCVNETMKTCDQSLKVSDIIGEVETSFNTMCAEGALGSCPGAGMCILPLMSFSQFEPTPSNGQPDPSATVNCSSLNGALTCLDTELPKCNHTYQSNYTFTDISGLFVKVCQVLIDNPTLRACPAMGTCMAQNPITSDPTTILRLVFDPQMWCTLLKVTMMCGETSNQCPADRSEFPSIQKEINQVCFGIRVISTSLGTSTSTQQPNNEQSTEDISQTTQDTSLGHVMRVGVSTILCLLTAVLFMQQP